ncbi:MAG TPA: hypothetical protein DDZ90_00720, partial [Planctomycetaceae bacterium]|nr:hypothetical protein [Planctomycetaceae bacterium]
VKPVASTSETQSEFELLKPRFNLIVSLAAHSSSELNAGQRVAVTSRPTGYSTGQYLKQSVSEWFHNKLNP